jgi:uncharacterized protein (DUF1810 family)
VDTHQVVFHASYESRLSSRYGFSMSEEPRGEPTLARFTSAQDDADTYERAVAELRAGYKTSHWMWFVFPQIAGLGQSAMSRRYAIASLAEAREYLRDPVLGARLCECARILTELHGRTAEEVFDAIDAIKLRSSMTLFALAATDDEPFRKVLDDYFDGSTDAATEALL